MKIAKIYTVLAAAAAMLGVASCDNPDTPVMQKPTEFKLNVPPFAQQYYELTEDGTLELTCSQPNYGIGTVVKYSAEVSMTEDFAESKPITNINGASASISLSSGEIATAMCELLGIVDDDTWQPFVDDHVRPLYIRAIAKVGEVEWSEITSNVIELPRVDFYYALKTPGFIFLTGIPSFIEPSTENRDKLVRLYEPKDDIGSQVYSAVVDAPAGTAAFRFYTQLGKNWDDVAEFSIGAAEPDMNSVNITDKFVDGKYEGDVVVKGRSNWEFTWGGGEMTITVNLKKNTISIVGGAQEVVVTKYVYMVGNQADWTTPDAEAAATYEPWRLVCDDGSGVYKGTFEISHLQNDASDLYCRFYQELAGWGNAQWASPTGGDYLVTPGVAAETAVGEGCFQLEQAINSTISVSLDTKANTVTFDFVD